VSKETEVINHIEGLDDTQKGIVGTAGQVQLNKIEKDGDGKVISKTIEFYDTVTAANSAATTWKG